MANSAFSGSGFKKTVAALMGEVAELYGADEIPWVIGYSGGKDSTAVLQLIWLALEGLPKEKRVKPVYVISTDTLVEKPDCLAVGGEITRDDGRSGQAQGFADHGAQAHARDCKYVLGELDRPRVSRAAAEIPMVHGTAQDQPFHQIHPLRRSGLRGSHPRAGFSQGRERRKNEGHGALRAAAGPRSAEPERKPPELLRLHADRRLEQRRRLAVSHAGPQPVGLQEQGPADDVPRRDGGRRMPARGGYHHAELRRQPISDAGCARWSRRTDRCRR